MASISLIQGNSSQIFEVSISGVASLTGYSCRLAVVKEDKTGNIVLVNRLLTSTAGPKFTGFILPAESETLPVATLKLALEVFNDSLFYKKEVIYDLEVRKQIIPSAV